MTEQQIRSLMAQQSEQGEQALFDTYYSYVYAIVHRKLCGAGTREDVEECVIDVFVEVFRRYDTIGEGALKAFIGTVARYRALNMVRYVSAKSRRTEPLDDAAELSSGQDVEGSVEQAELTDRLLGAVAALGEPDATIIIQKFFYGRNAREIAAVLGKDGAWVRNRCARALKRLREALQDLP